ncbi:choice-of-anchor P family protein [Haloechinothrix halophila]|uniref:choice-of-anchor P family protein n=1 Tax=Haloechinothrix halophila TaxID=1069073 RepID=UPI0003F99702|nr:choice-of-anchor P family protein [Haloechinothrix halophila]
MRPFALKFVLAILVAGLAGGLLPVPAHAEAEPGFSGYSAEASASPIQLDVYEPTIPVPATPQLRLMLGYATVEADSSLSSGRASFLWPGDFVGEGFRSVIDNLGLPDELSEPIGERGYPLQVNSRHPAGPQRQADEPVPGTVMRTSAGAERTTARAGYSSNCEVERSGEDEQPPESPSPGTPELPSLPGRSESSTPASERQDSGECPIPPQLAALVDVGGYIATSETALTGGDVVTRSRSEVSDVQLLGGLVTLSGVTATAVTGSDGAKGKASGSADYGRLSVAGQTFTVGPDGLTAPGRKVRLPGIPDDPAKALERLGITITVPRPDRTVSGDKAISRSEGLIVDVDTTVLRDWLDALPIELLAELINRLPDEASELKSLLGAALQLSPRFVIHVGTAASTVDTVQGIDIPLPGPEPGVDAEPPTGTAPGGTPEPGPAPETGSAAAPASTGEPPAPAVANAVPERASAGLPPLFSMPGALLFGGIALASLAGGYLRKLGGLVLGGGVVCQHGLRTGLPDLRKV